MNPCCVLLCTMHLNQAPEHCPKRITTIIITIVPALLTMDSLAHQLEKADFRQRTNTPVRERRVMALASPSTLLQYSGPHSIRGWVGVGGVPPNRSIMYCPTSTALGNAGNWQPSLSKKTLCPSQHYLIFVGARPLNRYHKLASCVPNPLVDRGCG